MSTDAGRRGGALLSVLWLSAALAAIAFSVALAVRGEIRRAGNAAEGLQAHYLAVGALQRGLTYILWGPQNPLPNGQPRYFKLGQPFIPLPFPTGEAIVEVIPESARMNVNLVPPEELNRLLLALGVDPMRAGLLTAAILDWRAPAPNSFSRFDQFYLQAAPSFRAPHASLLQIEELLSVQGVTPDLYYGRFERLPDGRLERRPGLRDCLSVYSANTAFDLNSVSFPVMVAIGVPAAVAESVIALRRTMPVTEQSLPLVNQRLGPFAGRFRLGGDRIVTLRATARMRHQDGRLSDLRRSAEMTVQFFSQFAPEGYRVLNFREAPAGEPQWSVWSQ